MSLYQWKESSPILINTSINEDRKNKYAEVLTPLPIIEELLDQFPNSCFEKKDWKWLDPAAGTGHFFLALFPRLMKGLKKSIPNERDRKSHILENMLFMVEINPAHVKTLSTIFGKKSHIIQGDFLTHDFKNQEFEAILGNPPFQVSKTGKYKGSVGNRTLWDLFLKKILETSLLKPNGYLGFLTPSSWRRPESKLYKRMVQDYYMKYLHIYGKEEGQRILGVQTRFDIYVIHASSSNKKTKIIDEKGKTHVMNLHNWPFLPNYSFNNFKKIMVSNKKNGIPILFDSSCYYAQKLSKTKSKKNKISVVHNITRKGMGLRYAHDKCSHLHKPKVLLNFNEKQYPINDYRGKYGMSQITFGIPIQSKKEGEKWIKVILSPFFQEIIEASKWSSFQTDYRMFSYFNKDVHSYP